MDNENQQMDRQGTYRIVIKGILDLKWSEWFDGFTITYRDSTNTLLSGKVQDQSALHGLLANIRDLGLTLISLSKVEEELENEKPSDKISSGLSRMREVSPMFHDIHPLIAKRMHYLEQIDAEDRKDGTPRTQRLRQIPPETGKFLALLSANAPDGQIIEIGTSAGYSTLWLILAAKMLGRSVITFEMLPDKVERAKETFRIAGVESCVKMIAGDAREYLEKYEDIAFCFLDAEKEHYENLYDLVVPRMVRGGLLVADNAINHHDTLKPMLERALHDERVDALIVPIGKGELLCRKV